MEVSWNRGYPQTIHILIVFFYYGNHPAITPRNRHSLTKASWTPCTGAVTKGFNPSLGGHWDRSRTEANDEIHVAWQIHTESFLFLMVIKCDKVIYYISIHIYWFFYPSQPPKQIWCHRHKKIPATKKHIHEDLQYPHPFTLVEPIKKKHRKTIYWLVVYLPLWKKEFVSWDDEIPNIWKVIKIMFQNVPNHQPELS